MYYLNNYLSNLVHQSYYLKCGGNYDYRRFRKCFICKRFLRIQTLAVGPNGKINETGSIEIPGNKVGDLITSLTAAAQGISEKIGEDSGATSKSEEKKTSSKKKKK